MDECGGTKGRGLVAVVCVTMAVPKGRLLNQSSSQSVARQASMERDIHGPIRGITQALPPRGPKEGRCEWKILTVAGPLGQRPSQPPVRGPKRPPR